MSETALVGQPGELCFTLEIIRAATGQKETVNLVGKIQPQPEEVKNGSDTLDSGS